MEQENTFSSNIRFFHEPQRLIRINHMIELLAVKWHTEFGHLNRGDMLTSEQHRCSNEKKKFQRRV